VISEAEVQEVLEDEPWLQWFLDAGDLTLDDARIRFIVAQDLAVKELRARHEVIEVRIARGDLLTTAYFSQRAEVER